MSYQEPIKYYALDYTPQIISGGVGVKLLIIRHLSGSNVWVSYRPEAAGEVDSGDWKLSSGKDLFIPGGSVLYAVDVSGVGAEIQVWEFYN